MAPDAYSATRVKPIFATPSMSMPVRKPFVIIFVSSLSLSGPIRFRIVPEIAQMTAMMITAI